VQNRDLMKRRGVMIMILALGLVLLALLGSLLRGPKPTEPTVKGQPISRWLGAAPSLRLKVGELAEVGTNAIPFLIEALRTRDVIPYNWKAHVWQRLPAAWRLKIDPGCSASDIRRSALMALREFEGEAQSALPAVLTAAARDPDVLNRSFALQAAVAINAEHPEVVALLAKKLQSSDDNDRSTAFLAMGRAGKFPRALTNNVRLRLDEANSCLNELLALGALGEDVAPFVPRIIPFLANESLCRNALQALRGVGSGGAAAVPALRRCLQPPHGRDHVLPAEVLGGIGPAAAAALPVLEECMRHGNRTERVMAAIARWRITGDSAPSARVILAALEEKDDEGFWPLPPGRFSLPNFAFNSRETVLWFVGELGPAAAQALPTLKRLMEDGPDWQRLVAARAVGKVSGAPAATLPVLQRCLASQDEYTRTLACHVAGEIGAAAAELLPHLEKATRTTLVTRRAALAAMRAIRSEGARGAEDAQGRPP